MDSAYLYIGLSIIALGFFVKAFPNLIAGYNTMTKEQKEQVNIQGLSTLMRNVFIGIGVSVIIFCFLLTWTWTFFFILFGGLIFLLIRGRKYDIRKKQNKDGDNY